MVKMEKADIKSLFPEEIAEVMRERGYPPYRANQVFEWLTKGADSFEGMRNLPASLKEELDRDFTIPGVSIERKWRSALDNTVKYLYRLQDGEYVEGVLMEYHHGHTLCLSTQAGCRMGCTFCATGMGGFRRNLLASEMLSQIQAVQKDAAVRVSNVVLMGMGEPLDNYDNVLRFLRLLSLEKGLNIGMRHISLSTCGVVPRIRQLQQENLQITLSVSLHAPNDEIRSKTMPVNRKWGVEELLSACRDYARATKRRISFEYAMIRGVNDSDECARELAGRLKGMLCHVNLIPVNEVRENSYVKSDPKRLARFVEILGQKGVNATVRRTLGSDIDASCGQLRGKALKDN